MGRKQENIKRYLTVAEAVRVSGVSRSTLQHAIDKGRLPATWSHIHNRFYIRVPDLLIWMDHAQRFGWCAIYPIAMAVNLLWDMGAFQ